MLQFCLTSTQSNLASLIGRIETQAKISKMLSIVRHRRKDDLSTFLANIKTN